MNVRSEFPRQGTKKYRTVCIDFMVVCTFCSSAFKIKMTAIKQGFLTTVCTGKEGNICAIWLLGLLWFLIPLKSKRLFPAAGRYESTQQLKEPNCKYVNDKKATLPFYLENCYLFRYLYPPAIPDLSSKTTKNFIFVAHSTKPRQILILQREKNGTHSSALVVR